MGFDSYVRAYEEMKIQIRGNLYTSVPMQFVYGLIYAVGSAFAGVFAKAFTAYFCAKYDTFFGKILYTIVVITMILPIVGTMGSTIKVMRDLNIYDNMIAILYYNAGFYGVYFLVMHATFKSISNAYGESAQIDGAGHFAVLFKIYLPMVIPSMFAVGIMQFISFWNDYQTPMVYVPSSPTIAYGLYNYSTLPSADNAPAVLAASMIVCIPTVALFCIFKNKIMGNISAGGLKG
jgi:multiple sugar transport system permease protein